MANNYLITGYWGEPHVTPENDRGIHAAMFGTGRFVLPVGEQFRAEYIGNNTIRVYDGKLLDNGAAAGIPAGEFVDIQIANAGQGMNRNDLIVFQYEKDTSTNIERGTFTVVRGEETSGSASDPTLTQNDLLSDTATFDQMALWRISVSGAAIAAPVKAFELLDRTLGTMTPSSLGMVKKLWSGSWSSGSLEVPGWKDYSLFTIVMDGAASPVLVIRWSSNLRGIGGNITSGGIWTMAASFKINSDDTWQYENVGYMGHTSSGNHNAAVTNAAVLGIWGVA